MQENLREICKKEIEKMKEVFENIKILDNSGTEIYNLALSYFKDSEYFLEKEDFIRSFESIVISWAYIDAGLHFKVFEIPSKLKIYFTVE